MSEIVAAGQALLQEQAVFDRQARLEYELEGADGLVVEALQTMLQQISVLTQQVAELRLAVLAPRIRVPVRDETGTIVSVVEQSQEPS